ncbi:hypothetical protein LDENG_00288170 [Lucifuga dentata]|nr:hypothetical protein LDENG_00288170 [Lucifuga dentata]
MTSTPPPSVLTAPAGDKIMDFRSRPGIQITCAGKREECEIYLHLVQQHAGRQRAQPGQQTRRQDLQADQGQRLPAAPGSVLLHAEQTKLSLTLWHRVTCGRPTAVYQRC